MDCDQEVVMDTALNIGLPSKLETDENKNCCDPSSDIAIYGDGRAECSEAVKEDSGDDDPDAKKVPDDGMDQKTFEDTKQKILELVDATKYVKGKSTKKAEKTLADIISACSKEQRKELMKVTDSRHYDHDPLSLACKMKNLKTVKLFVEECEADVNGHEGKGKPLLWAIANQDEAIVRYLLEHKADAGANYSNDFNLLMFSMKIFSEPVYCTMGYGLDYCDDDESDDDEDDDIDENGEHVYNINGKTEDRSEENMEHDHEETEKKDDNEDRKDNENPEKAKENESVPIPYLPKVKIVKLLIKHGAVEKCSDNQIFDIFRTMVTLDNRDVINIGSPDELYASVLPLLLKRIPFLANKRNSQGMSLLGYELLHKDIFGKCPVAPFMFKFLEKDNGNGINTANIMRNCCVPALEENQVETIETNVDKVLDETQFDPKTNDIVYKIENLDNFPYVHPLSYLACAGKQLLFVGLETPKVPFQAAFDALEAAGAYLACHEYFKDASLCWGIAGKIRQEINETRPGNKEKQLKLSRWEQDVLSQKTYDIACKLLNPMEGMPNVYSSMDSEMTEFAMTAIQMVFEKYEKWKGKKPLTVTEPARSVKFHLDLLDQSEKSDESQGRVKSEKSESLLSETGVQSKTEDMEVDGAESTHEKEAATRMSIDEKGDMETDKQPQKMNKEEPMTGKGDRNTSQDKHSMNLKDRKSSPSKTGDKEHLNSKDGDEGWVTDEDEDEDMSDDEILASDIDSAYEERNTRIAFLLRSALIHERLLGFGSFETMRAFKVLANEYLTEGFFKQFVTVIVYSFPYFIKHVSLEERYMNRDILKSGTLKKFIKKLCKLLLKMLESNLYDWLSFDLIMGIFKCFFLNIIGTPSKQRDFLDISPLLLVIKVLGRYNKSDTEKERFSQFMRKVVEYDLKNCHGQGLLHYAAPVYKEKHTENPDRPKDIEESIVGSVELVEILLRFGFNPNALDDFGMTPLHLCYRVIPEDEELGKERSDDRKNVICLLLKAGAHTDLLDARNNTPIHYSASTPVPLCPVGNRSLQCLVASSILNSPIPYQHHLPNDLIRYIEMHKKNGKSKSGKYMDELRRRPSMSFWTSNGGRQDYYD